VSEDTRSLTLRHAPGIGVGFGFAAPPRNGVGAAMGVGARNEGGTATMAALPWLVTSTVAGPHVPLELRGRRSGIGGRVRGSAGHDGSLSAPRLMSWLSSGQRVLARLTTWCRAGTLFMQLAAVRPARERHAGRRVEKVGEWWPNRAVGFSLLRTYPVQVGEVVTW
jgi:hypothetical protein